MSELKQDNKAIVFYDGRCGLCHKAIQFILKKESNKKLQFCSLNSQKAAKLIPLEFQNTDLDSMLLLHKNKLYCESTAALKICGYLKGAWPLMQLFLIVPKPIRDLVYRWVAENRYKWFGKKDQCMLADESTKHRFLE